MYVICWKGFNGMHIGSSFVFKNIDAANARIEILKRKDALEGYETNYKIYELKEVQ